MNPCRFAQSAEGNMQRYSDVNYWLNH